MRPLRPEYWMLAALLGAVLVTVAIQFIPNP